MEDIKTDQPKKPATPAANVAPGTEGAPHTGQIEPHSPAANALPNAGASGVSHETVAESVQTTVSTKEPNVLETNIPMTAERISVDENQPLPKSQNKNDVKFKVKYGKDYKGVKKMPEGSVQIVSKELADKFISLGIGSIIK